MLEWFVAIYSIGSYNHIYYIFDMRMQIGAYTHKYVCTLASTFNLMQIYDQSEKIYI